MAPDRGAGLPFVIRRGKTGLLTFLIVGSILLPILSTPVSGITGIGPSQNGGAHGYLAASSNLSSTTETSTQNLVSPPPNPGISCGFQLAQNSSRIVASSSRGTGMRIEVREPSWLQICITYGHAGESFPGYEIFPVTVYAAPGTAVVLSTGQASLSPEQISIGDKSNTIWTGFNPVNVTTDSRGIALSNFTLAGAVMPFVPNDISNVSLPIIARSVNGVQVEAGLPIEFSGVSNIHVLQTPGPILFPSTIVCSAGNAIQVPYGVVYAPPAGTEAQPVQVTLVVAGTLNNGAVGPPPSGVQVTMVQPSFVLYPDQVSYLIIDENNSIPQSQGQAASNYTIAIQERIGGNSYLEPLPLSVVTNELVGSFGTSPTASVPPVGTQTWAYLEAGLVTAVAVVVLFLGVFAIRRRNRGQPKSSPRAESAQFSKPS